MDQFHRGATPMDASTNGSTPRDDADIVIVGAGAAGAMAAPPAAGQGVGLVVLDQSPAFGGAGMVAAGGWSGVGLRRQPQHGGPPQPETAGSRSGAGWRRGRRPGERPRDLAPARRLPRER